MVSRASATALCENFNNGFTGQGQDRGRFSVFEEKSSDSYENQDNSGKDWGVSSPIDAKTQNRPLSFILIQKELYDSYGFQ